MNLFLLSIFLTFSIVRSADVGSVGHCDKDGDCPPEKKLTCHKILLKAKKKVTLNLIDIEDKEDPENQVYNMFFKHKNLHITYL